MASLHGEKLLSSTATNNVYSVSLPYLVSKLQSTDYERDGQVWTPAFREPGFEASPYVVSFPDPALPTEGGVWGRD